MKSQQTWASPICAVRVFHLPRKPRAVPSLCCSSQVTLLCVSHARLLTLSRTFDRAVYRDDKQLPAQLRDTLWLGVRHLPRLWLFYLSLFQQTNTKCILYAGQGPGAP